MGVNGEPKLGPCPEKWLPLLPGDVNDFALLQKCVAHIDVTSVSPFKKCFVLNAVKTEGKYN